MQRSVGNRPDRVRLQLEGAPAKPGGDVKVKIFATARWRSLWSWLRPDKVPREQTRLVSTSGTHGHCTIDKNWNRSDMYISTVVFRPGSQGDKVDTSACRWFDGCRWS